MVLFMLILFLNLWSSSASRMGELIIYMTLTNKWHCFCSPGQVWWGEKKELRKYDMITEEN